MGILDYSRANPWVGDTLTALSQGLLAYGSGNPQMLATLPLMMQQRRDNRVDSERQRRRDEMEQKRFQMELEEAQRTANARAAQQQSFDALLPQLPENLRPTAEAMGPGFVDLWGREQVERAFPDPESAPTVKDFYQGGEVIQKQWNPQIGQWEAVGQGPRWAPKSESDGIQVDYNGDGMPDLVIGGKMKPPTEAQTKSANQFTLLGNALEDVEKNMKGGGVSPWRMGASDMASQYGPIGQIAGQAIMSPEDKQFQAARAGALESLANSITGAAFTEEQKRNFIAMLPQATDDEQTAQYKLSRMRDYLAQLQRNAGTALPPAAPANDLKSKYGLE